MSTVVPTTKSHQLLPMQHMAKLDLVEILVCVFVSKRVCLLGWSSSKKNLSVPLSVDWCLCDCMDSCILPDLADLELLDHRQGHQDSLVAKRGQD